MSTITQQSLHSPAYSTQSLLDLSTPDGTRLTPRQAEYVAVVIDFFQAKGTMGKMNDYFIDDAIYEDLFATAKNREEVAGQLANLPLVLSSTQTHHIALLSLEPNTKIPDGKGKEHLTDLIRLAFKHTFVFKSPLPAGASSVTMDTVLHIYLGEESTKEGIVKLMDRGDEEIPDNAVLSFLRKFNAVMVPKVTSLPKDDKEDAERAANQHPKE